MSKIIKIYIIFFALQQFANSLEHHQKMRWSPHEDSLLKTMVQLYGTQNWKFISELLKNRTPLQCKSRWRYNLNQASSTLDNPWTSEEDNLLKILHETYGGKWQLISSFFKERSPQQLFYRFKQLHEIKPQINKSHHLKLNRWNEEEDELLLELVSQDQVQNWAQIAQNIPNRTSRQCKDRYILLLERENAPTRDWSKEEDEKLTQLIQDFGTSWKKIFTHFESRTKEQCRSRWRTLSRQNETQGQKWTHQEDILLNDAIGIFRENNWKKISELVPKRNHNQCYERWRYITSTKK